MTGFEAALPLVTVVIPVYNQAAYLVDAIESVLGQDYGKLELIVVNDGSTDRTQDVIDRYGDRIRSLSQENRGASNALNRGIKAASGDLVCWLSADDAFLQGKIAAQVAEFASTDNLALSATGWVVVDADGRSIRALPRPVWRHHDPLVAVFWQNPINGSSVMVRREVFDEVGYFDEGLTADVDADMWMRIALRHRIALIPRMLLRYRIHGAAMSSNRPLMLASMTEVRMRRLRDGSLRQRLEAVDPTNVAEVLARMSTKYAWRGLRQLSRELLRQSYLSGTHRPSQTAARAMLAATSWTALHRTLIPVGGRVRTWYWRHVEPRTRR